MSSYYDDDRPRRSKSHRDKRRVAEYDDDDRPPPVRETRTTRMDLVRSPKSRGSPRSESLSSIEEVQRDFPPGSYERTTRIRKGVRPVRQRGPASRFDDDESYFSDPRDRPRRTARRSYYEEDTRKALDFEIARVM